MTQRFKPVRRALPCALLALALLAACDRRLAQPPGQRTGLAGAWRSHVQFADGPFASVKDLEFMYAIHADGTLTESSNYDAAPPVPPAYGVWRQTGPGRFQLHYEFYATTSPKAGSDLAGGWPPTGRGLLDETVTLSADEQSFTSSMRLAMADPRDGPATAAGAATGSGRRIGF